MFLSVERKMERSPELKAKYREVIDNYREAGHMIEAPPCFDSDNKAYYMPHHPINFDPNKSKGKFRVVFNASAPSSNGVSFNDQQLSGPKLQDDLIEIFLRFRCRKYGMSADIKQMFRQVRINPEEYSFQRILWRDEPSQPLKQYFITVVSWGMTSAGYNSVRALQQCGHDGAKEYPFGSKIALNDFYFDDMLSGADDEQELILQQREVSDLLLTAGLELSKWSTNSPLLAKKVTSQDYAVPLECGILGMKWLMSDDTLSLNATKLSKITGPITKRKVVIAIASLYDPSGLVLPVIVSGKILQQNIWREKLGWDDVLPGQLMEEWKQYETNVRALQDIKVPRWLGIKSSTPVELHIFADASELAMGTCAYLVVRGADECTVNLVTSRSRVAPIKRVTIPRLELWAAVLAIKLSEFLTQALRLPRMKIYYWTDSMITCHWINSKPGSLTPYIANRVTAIQEVSTAQQWRHVPGQENPADLLTRGATVQDIQHNALWWHGPSWLKLSSSCWPNTVIKPDNIDDPEALQQAKNRARKGKLVAYLSKPIVPNITTMVNHAPISLLNKHSDLERLLRVTAYVLRFVSALKERISNKGRERHCTRATTAISSEDRRKALLFWIKHTQCVYLSKEIGVVKRGAALEKSSSICKLTPWLDNDNVLRITGRVKFSELPFGTKHQIIIPPESRLANLLVYEAHYTTVHGGPQIIIGFIRKSFWINRIRQVAKSIVHKCIVCIRHMQKPPEQLMGQLPVERITVGEPFATTGCDFAGPFIIKRTVGRPSRKSVQVEEKAWIVVFICLISRAVHIEVIFGLTVHDFLAAFERFVYRKGRCFKLFSDNGTTFVGTDNELARVLRSWATSFPQHKLAKYNTEWKFITPAAPHKGGIWEAAVKSFKYHLKRTIGSQPICDKTLQQLAVQIEGCLNSRPLWPASDDPSDLQPITPADLFLGKPILSQPLAEYVAEVPDNRLTWWKQRQKLHQRLWEQWSNDYLTSIQVRHKWYVRGKNMKPNDMVVVRDDNLPPSQWTIGRIVETFPDKEGLVRTVKIRTASSVLLRPLTKICILLPPDVASDPAVVVGGEDDGPDS